MPCTAEVREPFSDIESQILACGHEPSDHRELDLKPCCRACLKIPTRNGAFHAYREDEPK